MEVHLSAVAGTAVALMVAFIWWTWPYKIDKDLPGPPNLPYFGAIFLILKNYHRLPEWLAEMNEEYEGRVYGLQVPGIGLLRGAMVALSSPESVKHVLRDNFGNYVKGAQVRAGLWELLGDGIFTADGPTWKFHRKVASHMFSARLMRESTLVAARFTRRLLEVLRDRALPPASSSSGGRGGGGGGGGGGGEGSTVVDMQDMYFRLTMDIFTYIAFGEDLKSVAREKQHGFALAFDEVQRCSEARFFNPLWRVGKFLQLTASERAITRGKKVIDDFASRVIKSRRRDVEDAAAATAADADADAAKLGPDLLTRFLEDAAKKRAADTEGKSKKAGEEKKDEARTGGSDKELRDIVLNFMIAGRDTTACALSWSIYELARAPAAVRERLKAEFAEVFDVPPVPDKGGGGGNGNGGVGIDGSAESRAAFAAALAHVGQQATFEKVQSMKYAHAFAQEVLRLHPSVPKDVKFAVKKDVLPDGTNVPAGCSVIYSPYAMGRDGRLWEDPLKFDPDRFLHQKEPDAFKYTVFNAGYRLCLGKSLAMMELKLITGLLLTAFDVELAVPHAGGYQTSIVLPMRPGLMVRLTPRR
jgi:cytochrome P450